MADAAATHTLYDVLKDFQPSLAAAIALGAATLAYLGAMAKVKADRISKDEDHAAAKLTIHIQLSAAAQNLGREMKILAQTKASNNVLRLMTRADIPELEAAWANVAMLPSAAIEPLEKMRYFARLTRLVIDNINPEAAETDGDTIEQAEARKSKMLSDYFMRISRAAGDLQAALAPEISRLRALVSRS